MIYIHKEGCTHEMVTRRNKLDIQKEVINISMRSFAWKHSTWPNIFLLYNMNFQHTNIKDIPASNKTSSFGCFEKANKYYKNESRDSCHDATWKRKDRLGPLQEKNA